MITPTHNEIFMKDSSGSPQNTGVWETDIEKVVSANEGRAYLELDDYQLVMDLDYKQIVSLVSQFSRSIKSFHVQDASSMIRAVFYKSISIVGQFLSELHVEHANLVSRVNILLESNHIGQEDPDIFLQKIDRLLTLRKTFQQDYVLCKRAFFEARKSTGIENSEIDVQSFEIILREFELMIDPFLEDVEISLQTARVVFDETFNLLEALERMETTISGIYSELENVVQLADLQPDSMLPPSLTEALLSVAREDKLPPISKLTIQAFVPEKGNIMQEALIKLQMEKAFLRKQHILKKCDWCSLLIVRLNKEHIHRLSPLEKTKHQRSTHKGSEVQGSQEREQSTHKSGVAAQKPRKEVNLGDPADLYEDEIQDEVELSRSHRSSHPIIRSREVSTSRVPQKPMYLSVRSADTEHHQLGLPPTVEDCVQKVTSYIERITSLLERRLPEQSRGSFLLQRFESHSRLSQSNN